MKRNLGMALGVVALIVAIGAGYFLYGAAQKRSQQRQVVQLVADSTGKLRQALTAKADAALAAAIDANLQATRAPRDPQLASAAEQYILSAREITRRLADVDRLWRQAETSRAALNAGSILAFSEEHEKAVQPIVLGIVVPALLYLVLYVWQRLKRKPSE